MGPLEKKFSQTTILPQLFHKHVLNKLKGTVEKSLNYCTDVYLARYFRITEQLQIIDVQRKLFEY